MIQSTLVKIISDLKRDGITFESLGEKIDTGSASGKLQFHVFAALAEFECNLIRECTLAGLTAACARGRVGGRKPNLSQALKPRRMNFALSERRYGRDIGRYCFPPGRM